MPLYRALIATGFLFVGALAAIFLGGSGVTRCLGPLGRMFVDSVRDGCVTPTVGIGTTIGAVALVAAVVTLIAPSRRYAASTLTHALFAAAAGFVAYLIVRPTSLTGPALNAGVITVPMPFDWWAFLTAGVLAAGVGWVLGTWFVRRRLRGAE